MGGGCLERLTLYASTQHTDELVSERTGERHRCPVVAEGRTEAEK